MGLRDPVSSASHLLVAAWAIYAFLVLIRCTQAYHRSSIAIFGISMILLYTASGVFHGVPFTKAGNPATFRFFQRIDRSAIFVLIAGSNTPLIVTLLGRAWRRWFLWGIWTLALAGAACIWILSKPPHEAIIVICMGLGLLGFLPAAHYYRAVGWRAMNWALAGCVLYALGAVCELVEWPLLSDYPVRVGYHEVFHLFNAAASVVFFLFVARYIVPIKLIPAAAEHESRSTLPGENSPTPAVCLFAISVISTNAKRELKTTAFKSEPSSS
ncbi:MAG TPA: hemolysin III family protein [Gemmata sp.]|nr:hemolysin III family protein [Gemmata sp.]